jgi:predicted kinase
MGIPASGKTTYVNAWAEQLRENGQNPEIICPDDIREELAGDASDQTRNEEVFRIAHERLIEAICSKEPMAFFDATNIRGFARENILKIVDTHNLNEEPPASRNTFTILAILSSNLTQAKLRNDVRKRKVPEHAMDRMHAQMLDEVDKVSSEGWDRIIYV